MPAVAALLDSRAALAALRRGLGPGVAPVLACRTPKGLWRAVGTRLLEAIVLGPCAARKVDLVRLGQTFPGIPVICYGIFRSADSAPLLELALRRGADAILVEGVDDPVAGDLVARHTLSARRRAELADAPRLLRLTEPLQLRTWELLLATAGPPPPTAQLAARLKVSREHLSRQFAAGGAPNLKRLIDFLQVLRILDLLANPGYTPHRVSALLGYSTASHLQALVRRITRLGLEEAGRLESQDLLSRFLRGSARSRR